MKTFFIVAGIVAVLGVGYVLISPLWRNVRLDEALPQATTAPGASREAAPALGRSNAAVKDNLDTMDAATKERLIKETEKMKNETMTGKDVMPPNQPVVLAQAPMVAHAHDVAGRALLVQAGDQKILRFENLKTINGPVLRIYLSAGLNADDFVDLGDIRATEGNVNYAIPPGTDIKKYRNALIWCRTFGVLFSYAQF